MCLIESWNASAEGAFIVHNTFTYSVLVIDIVIGGTISQIVFENLGFSCIFEN